MNILFVLYHDFSANSAIHVHNFANQLTKLQHATAVAVPRNKDSISVLGERLYSIAEFAEVAPPWRNLFPNGKSPDIVHAWTPRENVRRFCQQLASISRFNLIVHLEDNEEAIVKANLGGQFQNGATQKSPFEVPLHLSHPERYRQFLGQASGVTIIMDRLEEFVPEGTRSVVVWPGADPKLFQPRGRNEVFRRQLGIPLNSTVLCYAGYVNAANARDVRSVYLAVAMLNREGTPTTLVRAGRDYYPFLGSDDQWARKYCLELGYVKKHTDIPLVLSLADILIQPGKNSNFNDYRLPSKLPEFFAMARPIILPLTNVGRFVKHGEHAWVLPKVDAMGIVTAVQYLQKDHSLMKRLSEGAREFYEKHFQWEMNTVKLEQFYRTVLGGKHMTNEAVEKGPDHPLSRPILTRT